MTRLHACAATGCDRQVASHLLMCIGHWRMVPAPLARAVLALDHALRRDRRNLAAVTAYRNGVAQAVGAVYDKQMERAAKAFAQGGDLFDIDANYPTDYKHNKLLKEEHGNNETTQRFEQGSDATERDGGLRRPG